ncbi:MAG TPA: hypothetical protein VFE51_20125 [Verrucomicrobiae bacterium]|nr:hypothetical protein [Verrucomicrobiae bacterium]
MNPDQRLFFAVRCGRIVAVLNCLAQAFKARLGSWRFGGRGFARRPFIKVKLKPIELLHEIIAGQGPIYQSPQMSARDTVAKVPLIILHPELLDFAERDIPLRQHPT